MPKSKGRKPRPQAKGNGAQHAPAIDSTRFVIAPKHILFAIPTYTGGLSDATQHALLSSSTAAHKRGWATDVIQRTADSCIQRARCFLFTHFLERTQCTDLMFIDADIGWEAEGFCRLMEHPVDIVGGAYRARSPEEHYILRPLENELMRKPPHGLMEVEGLGTGFLRITRRAAERMVAAYPDDWYTDPTCQGLAVRNLFEFEVRDHALYSEDYNFCRRWRAIADDCKVWVDPDQLLDHVGSATFRGRLIDYLQRNMPKIPAHVPQGGAAAYVAGQAAGNGGARPPATLLDAARALVGDAA